METAEGMGGCQGQVVTRGMGELVFDGDTDSVL